MATSTAPRHEKYKAGDFYTIRGTKSDGTNMEYFDVEGRKVGSFVTKLSRTGHVGICDITKQRGIICRGGS